MRRSRRSTSNETEFANKPLGELAQDDYLESFRQGPLRVFVKEGQTFDDTEPLFQLVVKNVFAEKGYLSLIPDRSTLIQVYLDYKDIADVSLLIAELRKTLEVSNPMDIGDKQKQGVSLLDQPQPGSPAFELEYRASQNMLTARCRIDVLNFLIRQRAAQLGIHLTEDLRLKIQEPK